VVTQSVLFYDVADTVLPSTTAIPASVLSEEFEMTHRVCRQCKKLAGISFTVGNRCAFGFKGNFPANVEKKIYIVENLGYIFVYDCVRPYSVVYIHTHVRCILKLLLLLTLILLHGRAPEDCLLLANCGKADDGSL
jgi:hypothetical protein